MWKILTEVASALAECHSKCSGTILHRDLKPANIFLDTPQTKCVKLGQKQNPQHQACYSRVARQRDAVGSPLFICCVFPCQVISVWLAR